MSIISKFIKIGRENEINRISWIKENLQKIPAGLRILDAGAGEQQFKKFCSHLNYVSQDFAQYEGTGDGKGLQMNRWEHGKLDIISDIIKIPEPNDAFDAIMCTEVFEHIPNPIDAIKEFSRLIKPGGYLLITAPFCSLTHFSPYHFATGFNRYYYEYHLPKNNFKILELTASGNYFEYIAQEILRVPEAAKKYSKHQLNIFELLILFLNLLMLQRYAKRDTGSNELLCYGYHILARKL